MTFVRFGDTYVNMERVNYIERHKDHAILYFSAPLDRGVGSEPDYIKLDTTQAIALDIWLSDKHEDANAPLEQGDGDA